MIKKILIFTCLETSQPVRRSPAKSGSTPRNTAPKKKLSKVDILEHAHIDKMKAIDSITLLNSPVTSMKTLSKVFLNMLISLPGFVLGHYIIFFGLPALVLAFYFVDGPHDVYRQDVTEFSLFASWWIGLGIASSVGLGTGLHTFVLYLGPYMAKVTLAANECNAIPTFQPNRWTYQSFAPCEKWQGEPTISVLEIYTALSIEAFLWGFGTAIGELPPYFVARAASIAGKKHEELEEIEGEISENQTLMDKLKGLLYTSLKKHAFIVVLLCASIPNPLFDLAGLTCGHFLIPFWTFFIATAIGKACIKVTIQSFFTIIMFSAHTVNKIIDLISYWLPWAEQIMKERLEKQKKTLYGSNHQGEEANMIAIVWNYVIGLMIAYFIYAFLNAIVQNQLKYEEEVRHKKED